MFEPVKASCKNTRRYCLLWALTRWSFWFFFSHEKKKKRIFAYFLSAQKVRIIKKSIFKNYFLAKNNPALSLNAGFKS